jgi:hypothetical protein
MDINPDINVKVLEVTILGQTPDIQKNYDLVSTFCPPAAHPIWKATLKHGLLTPSTQASSPGSSAKVLF